MGEDNKTLPEYGPAVRVRAPKKVKKPRKPPEKKPRGRLPTLTPAKQEAICTGLARGEPRDVACLCAGVPTRTFYLWLEKGRDADPIEDADSPYVQLLRAVEEAEARAVSFYVGVIHKAGTKGDVKAAAFYLERRRHADFGRRDTVKAEVVQRDFTDEDLATIRAHATAEEAATLRLGGEAAVTLARDILQRARLTS